MNCLGILKGEGVDYALYFNQIQKDPVLYSNQSLFRSASIIKIPILLSWIELEKQGAVDRHAVCELDGELQVEGAGFSNLFHTRMLAYQDVLLMMIATSDNLCTNLIIKEIGLERLQTIMRDKLHLSQTKCQRKLMDYAARERGLENWIEAEECVQFFSLISNLDLKNREWVKSMLAANTDDGLFKRNLTRDTVNFYHKTGSMTGVLHDWGFTNSSELFLLTQKVTNEQPIFDVFGSLGQLFLTEPGNP